MQKKFKMAYTFSFLIIFLFIISLGFNLHNADAKEAAKNIARVKTRNVYPLAFFKHRPIKFVEQLTQNPKRWPIALKSLALAGHVFAENHIKYSIIIVAYGPGLKAFVVKDDKKYGKVIEKLHNEGIKMVVCHESMEDSHITPNMLFSFVKISYPGIIAYIVKKEDQGYAFIKP
jgi:intracellular sulfur oxidation DsrE/DsrF family protein